MSSKKPVTNTIEIFWRFLILGMTSFGGPAAHIGYFRQAFVEKLNWLDAEHYARLIALSQFLPGPGSSQIGFAIGLHRGGLLGAVASFIAFTLPSFVLIYALAIGLSHTSGAYIDGMIHGLKLLALIVVLDASIKMWQQFCKQRLTQILSLLTTLALVLFPAFYTQIAILAAASLLGALLLSTGHKTTQTRPSFSYPSKAWTIALIALFIASFLPFSNQLLQLFANFFQAGSLVFGGGHVVLPLLQQTLSLDVPEETFLTAYSAAQALPGPMFTMATFIGAEQLPNSPLTGALLATLAIFLPGFLFVLALQNQWTLIAQHPKFAGAIIAVNASVVGFLIATFINPILPSALHTWHDLLFALFGFVLLHRYKLSVFWLIFFACSYGIARAYFLG